MSHKRPWFVPEVVQTSNMDCGPACLKSLLQGLGVNVHYGRLREACQTDVDGTSIDTLEEILPRLGVEAEQVVIPADHLLLDEPKSLPAIVVVRIADGATHFVVAWRTCWGLVQIMDPATGRRWPSTKAFLDSLHIHTMHLPASDWRDWAGEDYFLKPLSSKMQALNLPAHIIEQAINTGCDDPAWTSLAFLDALVRMLAVLVDTKAIQKGNEVQKLFASLLGRFTQASTDPLSLVPAHYWCVKVEETHSSDIELAYSGAVVLRTTSEAHQVNAEQVDSADLFQALQEKPSKPLATLWQLVRQDGAFEPLFLFVAMAISALGVLTEMLLFRGLIDVQEQLNLGSQRLAAVGLLCCFLIALVMLEYSMASMLLRFGRRLENRFRMLFLQKTPRLSDHFFHSRPNSDLAERSHKLNALRQLPLLAGRLVNSFFSIIATVAGLIWLAPAVAPWIILLAIMQIAIPFMFQPVMAERDLRVRTHVGALGQFYLDALLGLIPIRAHGAENAIRHEHESLLSEWTRASYSFTYFRLSSQAIQTILSTAITFVLIVTSLVTYGHSPFMLLLIYWALNLPSMGDEFAQAILEYPHHKNVTLRALEPLGARELDEAPSALASHEDDVQHNGADNATQATARDGVAIDFNHASIIASGNTLLHNINLHIDAGEHIAIVGESGAGKSSLVGLLLGWHKAEQGQVYIDGKPLNGHQLNTFRQQCAWIDPSVQLWNDTFLNNLKYGDPSTEVMSDALDKTHLINLVAKLPNGLQTELGEGGGFLSGGEGQRVRIGRAFNRQKARCVIMDEPFRGLDRPQREQLLANTRQYWQKATLLCITHDISETQSFARVLVIQDGQIVEDGAPEQLLKNTKSHYSQLLTQEKHVQNDWKQEGNWRKLYIEKGQFEERLTTQDESHSARAEQ
jgi:ATP-binding cassette subfamily B protein